MSHTTKASCGTVFIHNGDYSGDVGITVHVKPEELTDGPSFEHRAAWRVTVPFTDLRELVYAYLRDRKIEQMEQATDAEFEASLLALAPPQPHYHCATGEENTPCLCSEPATYARQAPNPLFPED